MKRLMSHIVTRLELELLDLEASPFETRFRFALFYKILMLLSRLELKLGPQFSITCQISLFNNFLCSHDISFEQKQTKNNLSIFEPQTYSFFCKLIFHLRESFILLRNFLKIFWFLFENLNFGDNTYHHYFHRSWKGPGLVRSKCLLCISTSFWVLAAPRSWLKHFFQQFFNLF